MNERTNITDKGYSYGGKDYVYETRTNPVTGVPYQVALEKTATTPTIQTTTAQRTSDMATQMKFDEIAKQKGISTPSYSSTVPAGWKSAVYGDPTKPSTITSYVDPNATPATTTEVIQPWTVNKNDSPDIVTYKNETKALMDQQQKMADEANAYFDQLKANAPVENQVVMDQIKAKYNATREKMKQNQANLMGLREKSGYATGGARYTQNQQAGIVANDINNSLVQLSELDAQEASEIMEASLARKKADWDTLQAKMNILDKINDNKVSALKNLNEMVAKEYKRVEAETKVLEKAKLLGYANPSAYAKGIAPALAEESLGMSDAQLDAFVKAKSTETGLDETVLRSAILEKRTALQKKATTKSTSGKVTKASVHNSIQAMINDNVALGGVPILDVNGFINPQAFEKIVQVAIKGGVTRAELFNTYKGKMYAKSKGDYSAYGIK